MMQRLKIKPPILLYGTFVQTDLVCIVERYVKFVLVVVVFIIITTYSSSQQVSGFSILYPSFSNCISSLLSIVGYGVPPDLIQNVINN